MKELPYFKFYVGDWLAGSIQMCDLVAQAVFVNLAALIWHKGGPVVYDPEGLARMLRTDQESFSNAITKLEQCQSIAITDGKISIKFLEEQQVDFVESHEKRVAAGKKGGNAKAVSKLKKVDFGALSSNARTKPEQSLAIKSKSKNKNKKEIRYIVEFLNNKAGTRYKSDSPATVKIINARLNEGWKAADFETVIDSKVVEWGNNADMKKFIRPETLFGPKFESYLQSVVMKGKELVTVNVF